MDQSLNIQRTYVQVKDIRMYYESHGEGIPVVLLHAGFETGRMWAPVVTALCRYYRVITPDSRGHGFSDASAEPITYPVMVDDLLQFIQALGLERPFIAGYSDGGQVARMMAIHHPGLARGYLLGGIFNRMTADWRGFMQGVLGIEGPGKVDLERVYRQNPGVTRDLQEKHGRGRENDYWITMLLQSSTRWWSPAEQTQADFAKIEDPTLFWTGDRDVFCPAEQSVEMYRMVKGAEVAIIPNADHFSIMAQKDIVNLCFLDFMNRVTGSRQ